MSSAVEAELPVAEAYSVAETVAAGADSVAETAAEATMGLIV